MIGYQQMKLPYSFKKTLEPIVEIIDDLSVLPVLCAKYYIEALVRDVHGC